MANFINIPNKIKTSLIVAIIREPRGGGGALAASAEVKISSSCRSAD
jgi:hypothetical protein